MSSSLRIVVIGGSAAGAKAAARARRLDEGADITIVQKDAYLSAASCAYPYYVGAVFDKRDQLLSTPVGVVRDPSFFMNVKNIKALTRTEALSIDRKARSVRCRDLNKGNEFELPYDKLIIATGSQMTMPAVNGSDLEGVVTLRSMEDADLLRKVRDEGAVKKALVVGGGPVGLEICEALHLSGIETTVVEKGPQVLTFLDWQLAKLVEDHMKDYGATVVTGSEVVEFFGADGRLDGARLSNGSMVECGLAVIATDVVPDSGLARSAGLIIGEHGGIEVDEHMQTSDPDIYAAGDCVESLQVLTGNKVHAPWGDLANLQGRVAGENAILGSTASHPGTTQTVICKIFDLFAGSTGLNEASAMSEGFHGLVSVVTTGLDRPGFMGGKMLVNKMVAEKRTGQVLGFQCVGPGDVSKQVAQAAMAIMGGLKVDDLSNADLPHAPPFAQPIDDLVMTAQVMQDKIQGNFQGISAEGLKNKMDSGERPFILDLRGPNEYETTRLGIGEKLIPLGMLRKRLSELPEDKEREIVCYCKTSLRGYEGARMLRQKGWKNARTLEGGVLAWPFEREK